MLCKIPDVPLQTELLALTIQLRTRQPSILAIQVGNLSHVLQMINTPSRLVRAHVVFCTSKSRSGQIDYMSEWSFQTYVQTVYNLHTFDMRMLRVIGH